MAVVVVVVGGGEVIHGDCVDSLRLGVLERLYIVQNFTVGSPIYSVLSLV